LADPIEKQLLDRLQVDIAAITVAGGYNYDLNGTDTVKQSGIPFIFDTIPGVAIAFERTQAEPGTPLTRYKCLSTFTVGIVVPYAAETTISRTLAALKAAQDIRKALELDRTLNGLCYSLNVDSVQVLSGDDPELDAQYAAAQLSISVWHEHLPGGA